MKKLKFKLLRLARYANLPRIASNHLIGKHHTYLHRVGVGLVIMQAGGAIVDLAASVHWFGVGLLIKSVGWAIHGAGVAPLAEPFLTQHEQEQNSDTKKETLCLTCN